MSLVNNTRETWLHGWPRMGTEVLIGTGVCCVGCGKDYGITTVALDAGYEQWAQNRPYPDWPFDEATCPICYLRDMVSNEHGAHGYKQIGVDGTAVRDLRGRLPK